MHYLYAKKSKYAFGMSKKKEFLVDVDNIPALLFSSLSLLFSSLSLTLENVELQKEGSLPDPSLPERVHVLARHDIRQHGNIW